jgi:hypothetical protein
MNSWPTVAAPDSAMMEASASGCRWMKLRGKSGWRR